MVNDSNATSILLSDGQPIFRHGLWALIDPESDLKVVGEAGNYEDTARLMKELNPNIIILDIDVPPAKAIERVRNIKLLCPECQILVLTTHDSDAFVFPLLEIGVAGYLLKDVSCNEILQAIKSLRHGDCFLHPAVTRKVMKRISSAGTQSGECNLEERECEILKMAANGMCNKDIANELSLSVRAVEANFHSIFKKLGVGSRTEAVVHAMKRGWFTLEDLDLDIQ